jgi:hypothetical protein
MAADLLIFDCDGLPIDSELIACRCAPSMTSLAELRGARA